MENVIRRHRLLQDQENVMCNIGGTKNATGGGLKLRNGAQRGVLGDLSNNLPARAVDVSAKICDAAAEFEKKATISRAALKSYKHVQSKVDTGLSTRAIVAPVLRGRPPIRREEVAPTNKTRLALQSMKISSTTNAVTTKDVTEVKYELKTEKKSPVRSKLPRARPAINIKTDIKEEEEEDCQSIKTESDSSLQLPSDVEDVDAGDDNSPLLLSIYIKDIYRYLTELELKYDVKPNYLDNQEAVTGRMRATLVDWLVDVQRQFNLLLETFQMTVGILDRYLQAKPDIPREKLQLVGVTALFIASKYEEVFPPDVHDIVLITDNAYHKRELFLCERDIMHKLGFCLGRPLPLHFLRRFVKVAEGTSTNHHMAKYLVDLSLVHHATAHRRPSELAAAAMCLSLHLLDKKGRTLEETWSRTLEYYSGYSLPHLRPVMQQMVTLVAAQGRSRLRALYKRYSEPSLASVAALPVLRGPLIEKLAAQADLSS